MSRRRRGEGQLVFRGVPPLHVQPRDAVRALDFLRDPVSGQAEPAAAAADADLPARVASHHWYHTIELPDGVVTPGHYDHRPLVPRYGLPASLAGARALDVATFDGFWAFELERRGAVDVVALDLARASQLDLPPPVRRVLDAEAVDVELGRGFAIAQTALGSEARRVAGSVYDLDPAELGRFDFVHMADVLLHLERPLEALRRLRAVTSGRAHIVDAVDPDRRGHVVEYRGGWSGCFWWLPSVDALAQMVLDAGFAEVRLHAVYNLPERGVPAGQWRAVLLADA